MTSPVTQHLERARLALAGGRDEESLRDLLAAWQQRRATDVAALIDRVSARLEREQAPLPREPLAVAVAAWLEAADGADDDPARRGRLLTALTHGKAWKDPRCVHQLRAWDDDPRVAMALLRRAATGDSSYWFQSAAMDPHIDEPSPHPPPEAGITSVGVTVATLLAQHADPRVAPVLDDFPSWQTENDCNGAEMLGLLLEASAALHRRFPDGAPHLDDDEQRAAAAIAAHLSGSPSPRHQPRRHHDDYLTRIGAAPDDDGLRQVFADWLLEQGDPRGELINLQLRRHGPSAELRTGPVDEAREAALLATHGRRWLGAIERVVAVEGLRWERGFPVAARVSLSRHDPPDLALAPEWSTLREIELARWSRAPAALLTRLPSLRSLAGVHLDDLIELLARAEPLPFSSLAVWALITNAFEDCRCLPHLRRLHLSGHDPMDFDSFERTDAASPRGLRRFWTTPIGRQLEHFSTALGPDPTTLADWLEAAADYQHLTTLELRDDKTATFRPQGWSLTLTLDEQGRRTRLHARAHPPATPRQRLDALLATTSGLQITVEE